MGVGGIRFIATILPFRSTVLSGILSNQTTSLLGSVHQISWPNLFQRSSALPFTLTVLLFATAAFEIKGSKVPSSPAGLRPASRAFEPPKQKLAFHQVLLLFFQRTPLVHINHLLDLA
jgi:hypothetical protein